MTVEPYRRVLANPGVRLLLLVGLLARIPVIAAGLTLTLQVVNGMDLGFLRAGLVGAASTAGIAVGAPVAGRFVDRYGLRPVLAVTTVAQLAFWLSAASLPYWPLAAATFAAGVLMLPVFSVIRQCVAAAVPAEQRRTGFTLDSMLVEVSYMIGPAAAVSSTAAFGSGWTMVLVGLGLVGAGVALLAVNPPTRTDEEREVKSPAVSRRQWLTPALLALLGVTLAATFVLTAAELSVVAVLKADDATRWTGLVIGLIALSSLVGGFVYGALPRGFSPLVMVGGIAVLTVPLGLVGDWQWLCLALIPSGLFCAPALSATVDAVSRRVPTAARGEAMGLHGTALTLGLAASGPVTGLVIDHWGTDWSFAVAGVISLLLIVLATPFWRHGRPPRPAVEAALSVPR
ncbi:MFS transporter [Actinomadura sp. DC4]|uniref:MFS transporter n=1 Tax=Actinomadura sp. DC4 TaxID=3055069 RepID=UPI0025AF99CB|nr:MFS transporter [Actinomadura sp. DC4]MDN3354137.1 MFS transporter [Actinomadura sp. DC4]